MGILSIAKREKSDKPLAQAVLEQITGRNLDPIKVTYSNTVVPVGKGYFQTITTRMEENLRTGKIITTNEAGNIV